MNYGSQEEHDYYESGAAQAEAEYQEQQAYHKFLDGLIDTKQYYLHAIYVMMDVLNSHEFKHSKLPISDFLIQQKNKLENPVVKEKNDVDDIPFLIRQFLNITTK